MPGALTSDAGTGAARRSVIAVRALTRFLRSPLAVLVLAVVAMGLGYWGFSLLPDPGLSVSDRAYETLQLLNVQASIPAEGTPWQLDVARFLAPLVIPYAALVALFAVAGGRAQRLRLRLFARNQVLIVGIGERGAALARALRDTHHVVAMEIDGANGAAQSLRKTGVPVLTGDARDPGALRFAHPQRAAHVVLLAGSDTVNLEILAALRSLIDPERPVATHAAIDAPGLWAELHRLPYQAGSAPRRVDFLNIPDRIARVLVDAAIHREVLTDSTRAIAIHGGGPQVARLIVQLLRTPQLQRAHEAGEPLAFDLHGPDPAETLSLLNRCDAWVFDRATLETEVSTDGEPSSLAFVCGLGEAAALESAVSLRQRLPSGAEILVAVPDSDTQLALEQIGTDLGVELVPTTKRILSEELFRDASFERIARGRHEEYLRRERAKERRPAGSSPLVPWEQLDERGRLANWRYADGVADALADIGAELAPLSGSAEGELPLSMQALDYLAVREHNRWWRDQCRDGVTYAPGPRTESTHPLMKPWGELDDSDREKDRDSVRILPRLLAEIGYEIVIADEGEVERRIAAAPDPLAYRPGRPECAPPE